MRSNTMKIWALLAAIWAFGALNGFAADDPLTIGVLHWEKFAYAPMMRHSYQMALEKIEQQGGIRGQRLNLVFADTHAGFERRHPEEIDWWSYHSRRGWEDADPTGIVQ